MKIGFSKIIFLLIIIGFIVLFYIYRLADRRFDRAIENQLAETKIPFTYSKISLNPLRGRVSIDSVAFSEESAGLEVKTDRVKLKMTHAEAVKLVKSGSTQGLASLKVEVDELKFKSRVDSDKLTVNKLCLNIRQSGGDGEKGKKRGDADLSEILSSVNEISVALFDGFKKGMLSAMRRHLTTNDLRTVLSVRTSELSLTRINADAFYQNGDIISFIAELISPTLKATLETSVVVNHENFDSSRINKAVLTLNTLPEDYRVFLQEVELATGKSFPRTDRGGIIIELRGTFENPVIPSLEN